MNNYTKIMSHEVNYIQSLLDIRAGELEDQLLANFNVFAIEDMPHAKYQDAVNLLSEWHFELNNQKGK